VFQCAGNSHLNKLRHLHSNALIYSVHVLVTQVLINIVILAASSIVVLTNWWHLFILCWI